MVYRSPDEVSAIMRKVKEKDTKPELILRKALWSKGIRYKLHDTSLPGKPDLVFPAKRLVVFVDGDFWHGHQWKRRKLTSLEDQFHSTSNSMYWTTKIKRTIERDRLNTIRLLSKGWRVFRFWESSLTHEL